jgi:hypothetical protein
MREVKTAVGKAMVTLGFYGFDMYVLLYLNMTAGVVLLSITGIIHGFIVIADNC